MEEIDKIAAILKYGMCRCGDYEGTEGHTCPFGEDVNDDHISLCNCCDYCCQSCADDI